MGIEKTEQVALPKLKYPTSANYWISITAIQTATQFPDGRVSLRLNDGSSLCLGGSEADAVWIRLQKSGRGFICQP